MSTSTPTYVTDNVRQFGLPPGEQVSAADQLQKSFPKVGLQPLPPGSPGRVHPDQVGIEDSAAVRFTMIGDSGGIKDPNPQINVATAMTQRLVADPTIAFCYHVGDEVYFGGEQNQYASQFYEPYAHFNKPMVGVPGNHDGAVDPDDAGNPTGRMPLDTFMANFCDVAPHIPVCDPQFEFGRHTQTQPYCDWTLNLQNLTVIGLYSNVPSGGHLYDNQVQWLTSELAAAPANTPAMLVLHHPPYSIDAHHGGSASMGAAIDKAAKDAGRFPTVVVSGHVHNYQRFTRQVNYPPTADGTPQKYAQMVPYIVIGNSGYHNLHGFAKNATAGMDVLGDGNVKFQAGDDKHWGFLVVTVGVHSLGFEYVAVGKELTTPTTLDAFTALI